MFKMLMPPRFALVAALLLAGGCDSGAKAPSAGADAKAGPAAAAAASRDWTATVVQTPEAGYRMGNPDARQKLVEFASFTCGHCRDFHLQAEKNLKPNDVRAGRISYEYRPFMLNIYDFAAVLLATCEGPSRFFIWANELYQNHDEWISGFSKLTQEQISLLRARPPEQQVLGLAQAGGLDEFARRRGMPKARFEQCLTNQAMLERYMKAQEAATQRFSITGTPTFLLNGSKLDNVTRWDQLQPRLGG